MNETVNRQILLVEKPTGKLGPEHFKMAKGAIPEPKDGEVLVRARYISLDAANRAWMHGATYRAAVEANTVMAGGGIAEVVSSKAPGLSPGDIVFGDTAAGHHGVGLDRRAIGGAMHPGAVGGVERNVARAHQRLAVLRLGNRGVGHLEMFGPELAARLFDQQDLAIDGGVHGVLPSARFIRDAVDRG